MNVCRKLEGEMNPPERMLPEGLGESFDDASSPYVQPSEWDEESPCALEIRLKNMQDLICYLLHKNQQLRSRLDNSEHLPSPD